MCTCRILVNVLYTPKSCKVWNRAGCDRFPRDAYVQLCGAVPSPAQGRGAAGDAGQAEAPGLSVACVCGGLHYLCFLGITAVACDFYFILLTIIYCKLRFPSNAAK